MIVDIPSHDELIETGLGWLHLAWGTTVECLQGLQEHLEYHEEHLEEELPPEKRNAYWHAQHYQLNNAVALVQQAMELILKGKIAEVSPFLLIAGDPRSWPKPKPDGDGTVSFTDFRTIDASLLCAVATTVCVTALPPEFQTFFERIRKHRNKIAHLNAGNARVEAKSILLDILKTFGFLFPGQDWAEARRPHLEAIAAPLTDPFEEDGTHSAFLSELRVVIETLDRADAKRYLSFDGKQRRLPCPECAGRQAKWDDTEADLAQRLADQSVQCIACGTKFTAAQYKERCAEYFGE